ncbi:MAG: hypothetical protein J5833_05675 [Victivallales bacterium]|nr:hypothetical protein [Victivallales bacterium]
MPEKNYDFRRRHWQCHRPALRNPSRCAEQDEIMLDGGWRLAFEADAPELVGIAVRDFRDYLETSQSLSLSVCHECGARTVSFALDASLGRAFTIAATENLVIVAAGDAPTLFRAVVYMEDSMSLEGAPLLPKGHVERHPIYRCRMVHSGCGIDDYPDEELLATIHAGYDCIVLFLKDMDVTAAGPCNVNDILERAERLGLKISLYNYMGAFKHPDDSDAAQLYDSVFGELFRRYPLADSIKLVGESLEFPSKDAHTTGKRWRDSVIDGIPDTRPSPGWYPCSDYPAYLQAIERAVHSVKPTAEIIFSTYNWGYAPFELRKEFIDHFPKNVTVQVTYEIFSQRTLEGLHTPVMDYTISAQEPGYYFTSEAEAAHTHGIPIVGNVNTAGCSWDLGCIPYVPVPYRWFRRSERCRQACFDWGIDSQYATHHYGWWNCVASDIGKWMSYKEFVPEIDTLLEKVARRDYGPSAAPFVMAAWRKWSDAMDFYVASNEDQYGPWRVGPAYPFIFQPNISRTMANKEIRFPTAPRAHFGHNIIKTLYMPYENAEQSPGFLRYPAELRSLEKMLKLWNEGLDACREGQKAVSPEKSAELARLEALGHFIRNSIVTVMNIKRWWLENTAMIACATAADAERHLDAIEKIARDEIANALETIPAVETDSRIGWEPSMEYVCDRWHIEWKARQVESALREIAAYRKMLRL